MAQSESSSFTLLNPKIQRWIWQQGWTDLREAQELAVRPILSGDKDLIISAGTASGKTEAAFLPIISSLLKNEPATNSVLYVSPLKALINDQFSRMELLCRDMDIQVIPWHGDISASKKKKFFKYPQGILLITPESLEAIFVNHGTDIPRAFGHLSYIVVDELHSFVGSERGRQLQSLLHRIEISLGRKVPRIGLSATISDMGIASNFLRPGSYSDVSMIKSCGSQELKLVVKGYLDTSPNTRVPDGEPISEDLERKETDAIADSIYQTLRGTSNLVFANSRGNVEKFADALRSCCAEARVPNEFWAHHGSLSKELREDAETAIKDKSRPVTIVCTSTLEMGIDIGSVTGIAQIGAPPSVSSLRQRLGRSGRRGEPAILRIYIRENELSIKSPIEDQLRAELIQTIAMVRLLANSWLEPPINSSLHLSTLIQQILSLIAQSGGITAAQGWQVLCKVGPFANISENMYLEILRNMGQHELLMQTSDGLLLHGKAGERIVNHYSFYTAFITQEEYRLITEGKSLGTLPIDRPVSEGSLIIFGGKRWKVLTVDDRHKVIELAPARGGNPPSFSGEGGSVHDRVRQEMFALYKGRDVPAFLDKGATDLLVEAQENFRRYQLDATHIIAHGKFLHLFCWAGDRTHDTIAMLLTKSGLEATNRGIAIEVTDCSPEHLKKVVQSIILSDVDSLKLAAAAKNKVSEKYHPFLSEDLLRYDFAASKLDVGSAISALKALA